jgi:hypothetical protein
MFGIIADHSFAENKTHFPFAIPAFMNFFSRKIFCGQPKRIPHSRAKQQPGKTFL